MNRKEIILIKTYLLAFYAVLIALFLGCIVDNTRKMAENQMRPIELSIISPDD
jgi:hypothetical protein